MSCPDLQGLENHQHNQTSGWNACSIRSAFHQTWDNRRDPYQTFSADSVRVYQAHKHWCLLWTVLRTDFKVRWDRVNFLTSKGHLLPLCFSVLSLKIAPSNLTVSADKDRRLTITELLFAQHGFFTLNFFRVYKAYCSCSRYIHTVFFSSVSILRVKPT